MSRCGCDSVAPGTSTCQCYFNQFGFNNQFVLSGTGDPADPIQIDFFTSAWFNLPNTYVNGWSAYAGTTYDVPQYRILWGAFLVQLRGRLLHPADFVKGQTILSALPSTIRPSRTKFLVGASLSDNAGIGITPGGVMTNEADSTLDSQFISLDGMHYAVAP